MGRLAFLCAGQGDQFPGMGRELLDSAAGAAVFSLCDRIRPGTSRQCFEADARQLQQTAQTQPCLYCVELAYAAALREMGIVPDAVAGFSLGEMTAGACAGLYDWETGFRLVIRRGELMEAAAGKQDASMAAVLKLSQPQVEALCARFPGLYPVNFNAPGQITVSGLSRQMEAFLPAVKAAGGRAVPLRVSGAFHSPFMEEAAEAFGQLLGEISFSTPSIPLYSDWTGRVYDRDPGLLLSRQISHSVQWETLIRNMLADGVDTFVELGPGRTLTNLMRRIDPTVTAVTAKELWEEYHAKS